jgi:hypothetical protein
MSNEDAVINDLILPIFNILANLAMILSNVNQSIPAAGG